MKKYLIFCGKELYYASGGFNDFFNSYDTIEECHLARAKLEKDINSDMEWWHIVDRDTLAIVEKSINDPHNRLEGIYHEFEV